MNETNETPRQLFILNLINQSDGLLREAIQAEVAKVYAISKPPLIRDLNVLIYRKLIQVKGQAKNTIYAPIIQNPLLRSFDLNRYFQEEPDKRVGARKSFDFGIFDYLHDLLIPQDLVELNQNSQSFDVVRQKLSPDILKRELERLIIELSWKSSKIEGNTYSLLETEVLLKEEKEAVGKQRSEATMIINHKLAFEEILKRKKDFRNVSISLVNQLHIVLVKDLGVTTGLRKQAVGITGTVYVPPDNEHQVREAFEKTLQAIHLSSNPFEKALIVHVMIPYIQPYADGNTRTARMLTNAILLAYDYLPISYRSVDDNEFKQALILFYEQRSLYHSKRLFIEQIKFANEKYFRW